jgi:hypothetical protein
VKRGLDKGRYKPLLANIYLHYVLDEWFERGEAQLSEAYEVRYADDFIYAFSIARMRASVRC